MAIREATFMDRLLPICFTYGKKKTFSTIKKVSKCYEHDCRYRSIFKWKHSKHSILVEILLREQIKAEKHFLKSPQKENFMQKVFQALSWFPGKPFQIRNFKICRKLKVPFSKIQNICFWPQAGFNLIF